MIWVYGRIIITLMAAHTSIWCIGIITHVAYDTIIGYRCMSACKWINCIMVKSRRLPGCLRVTNGAVCRKLRSLMIWVGCPIKIGSMTSKTRIWGIIIVTIVAGSTIIGNRNMCAGYNVIIIMVGECSRAPARSCSMTCSAIGRYTRRNVIGIERRIKICLVTAYTGIWRIVVIAHMTYGTII